MDTMEAVLDECTFLDSVGVWSDMYRRHGYCFSAVEIQSLLPVDVYQPEGKSAKAIKQRSKRQKLGLDDEKLLDRPSQFVLGVYRKHFSRLKAWLDLIDDRRYTLGRFSEVTDGELSTNLAAARTVLWEEFILNRYSVISHLMVGSVRFVLPPLSAFLMSDLSGLDRLVRTPVGRYELIVLDPPWTNQSAHRGKTYGTMEEPQMLSLPLELLLSPAEALVAIWVTNNPKVHSFVFDRWLPSHGLEHISTWYWLKITSQGDMVIPLSPHLAYKRRPYEMLVLARRTGCLSCRSHITETAPCAPNAQCSWCSLPRSPREKVIVSKPELLFHSRKPPIHAMLEQLIPLGASKLEMFARNLLPGWTSWGNEVIKHQNGKMFCVAPESSC